MKTISSSLTAAVQESVTTLALLVEIVRQDTQTYYLTDHNTDIVFGGRTYRSDIAFTSSSISSGSALNIDNVNLSIALDGSVFVNSDFKAGKFLHAEVTIRKINFADPTDGALVMRKGWFGTIEYNQQGFADITIVGMLKTLDFEVGRTYQPSCDADLGDKRCRVAVDWGQAHSARNPYSVGDWVYKYDPAAMTAFSVINPSFEVDGARTYSQAITGWTKVMGEYGRVHVGTNASPGSALLLPAVGTYCLSGYTEDVGSVQRDARSVYQDLDLVAGGIAATDIDAGRITFLYSVALAQTANLKDPVRISMDIMDAAGTVIDSADTRYLTLDAFNTWRDRTLATPLIAGARSIRIYIHFYRLDANLANCAADDVRCYWWDHTTTQPHDGVIHKVSRIIDVTDDNYFKYPLNSSFEADAAVIANSAVTAITGWSRPGASDYWRVLGTAPVGTYYLVGGDSGSAVQETYTLTQIVTTASWGLDPDVIDLERVVARFSLMCKWINTTSSLYVYAELLNASASVLATVDIAGTSGTYETNAGAPVVAERSKTVTFPVGTRSIKFYIKARSPVGDSNAQVGFDDIRAAVINAEAPDQYDPVADVGVAGTAFSTSSGTYTLDGNIVWKAFPESVFYDVVASVTNKKRFAATTISGVDDLFTGAPIRWLTGNNAGRKNVIRTWDTAGKIIKLYFAEPGVIQAGDRFMYTLPCKKRFLADCTLVFDNAVNFRGFPHLPGRLTAGQS